MPALVHAIDVSSHQPRDLTALIREHRPAHVIVRMYLPEEGPPQEHSIAQVESARANGCSVGAYVWAYRSLDPRKTVRDGLALARRCGFVPPVLWLDCETYLDEDPGPDAAWLREAVDECRRAGVQPGLYTGGWWWRDKMGDTTEFADLPLWAAEYCEPHDPASCTLFGGRTRACGKQWTDDPIDCDVLVEEVCASRPPTLEEVERANPNLRGQPAEWRQARRRGNEDPDDYAAFRDHLSRLRAPDPGPVEFVGFRRRTLRELEAANPALGHQVAAWRRARVENGEDPDDYQTCRRHLVAIGAPDPGEEEFDGFRG